MERIVVHKSAPLRGRVRIDGSKNAALPIIAGALLSTEDVILEDVPNLRDIQVMVEVLRSLGAQVEFIDEGTLKINASQLNNFETPFELMNKMRASFLVMGPLLARLGKTVTTQPGGCAIGTRPVDLHLKGFYAMGAEIILEDKRIGAEAVDGLKGGKVYLDFPSVGATQNIMMAATMAHGETVIENAAKEPEIVDLAGFLSKMGARIRGAGTSTITIEGVEKLNGGIHQIIPDRIEASTFMIGAAMTGGDVVVENVIASHIRPIIAKLQEVGATVEEIEYEDMIRVRAEGRLKATKIRTLPYPGFPTDVQAQFMTLLCLAEGRSEIEETVFENRFMHVKELNKMGAMILTEGNEAKVLGVERLFGATVKATDLRAGASMVLAGLVAEGETTVLDIYHIDRGYNDFVGKLKALGATIERYDD